MGGARRVRGLTVLIAKTVLPIEPLLRKLAAVPGAMKETMERVVPEEAKEFVKTVVSITLPASKGKTGSAAKKQGEESCLTLVAASFFAPSFELEVVLRPLPDSRQRTIHRPSLRCFSVALAPPYFTSMLLVMLSACFMRVSR